MKTLLILLLSVSAATAQWKQMPGPYGAADLNGFASVKTNLFVAAGDNIYRSGDSGATWSRVTHWPSLVYSFFCHDTMLFVITDEGTYRSRDLGANWESLTNPFYQGTTIYTTPRGLFTWRDATGLASDTLMFSSDEGTTWQFQPVPWMQYPGTVVTAGTTTLKIDDYGVSRSTDSGKTWTATHLDSIAEANCVLLFAKDNIVLAAMGYWHQGGDIYCSNDAGITWHQTNLHYAEDLDYTGGFQIIGNLIFIANGSASTVYMSSDSGHSWRMRSNSYNPQSSLFAFGENLYIGGGHSPLFGDPSYFIYRSRDSAKTWSFANTALPNTAVNALAANPNTLFAAVDEALEASTDDGETWRVGRYCPDKQPYWLVARDSLVIVGGGGLRNGSLGMPKDTLFSSTDNGYSFYSNDLAESVNYGIAMLDSTIVVATPPGLLVSYDKGRSFVLLDSTFQFVYNPVAMGNNIFVWKQQGQIYATSNLGKTWTQSRPDTSSHGSWLYAVKGLLFVSTTYHGVQCSTDTGRSWRQLTSFSDDVEIVDMATASGYLFASVYAPDSVEERLYGRISMSSDDGAHWHSLPVAYPDSAGRPNTLLVHDGYLFAGGPNGLWRCPLAVILSGANAVKDDQIASAFSMFISPNPARDAITVTLANMEGTVRYEIADELGRTVNAGETRERNLTLSTVGMSSGLYTFRSEANGSASSRRFVVMR